MLEIICNQLEEFPCYLAKRLAKALLFTSFYFVSQHNITGISLGFDKYKLVHT
jgi:hypothetical protein